MKTEEWPSPGDLVVVKIKQIIPGTGVKAELLEYPGKEGFIHISQVARSWVKNIRSFVSAGSMRVAYVERVRPRDGIINLSLRKVSPQQQKRKMDDWKREKRADKMFEAMCKDLGEDFVQAYKRIAVPLIDEYGDLLAAFENVKVHQDSAFEGIKIPKKWKEKIKEFAEKNITISNVSVESNVKIVFKTGDGLESLKKALSGVEKQGVKVLYLGAPNYKLKAESHSYSEAEEILDKAIQNLEEFVKAHAGEFSRSEAQAS